MNKDTFEGRLQQLRGDVEVWLGTKLNEPQITLKGNGHKLAGWLQEQKGLAREDAEREVQQLQDRLKQLESKWENLKNDSNVQWSETEEAISAKIKEFVQKYS